MIEGGPPNALYRRGFTKDSLPNGVEILVEGFRAKDGSLEGNGRDLTFARRAPAVRGFFRHRRAADGRRQGGGSNGARKALKRALYFDDGARRRSSSKKLKMNTTLSCFGRWVSGPPREGTVAVGVQSEAPEPRPGNAARVGDQGRGLSARNESPAARVGSDHDLLIGGTEEQLRSNRDHVA